MAIWLITSHKKGVASTQLARDIQVTQKTAWFILHRLRQATPTKSFNGPLKGFVEADETFIGGKERNKHAADRAGNISGFKGKSVVLGMLERGGELRAFHIPSVKARDITPLVTRHVALGSNLMTDEYPVYSNLPTHYPSLFGHALEGEYVRKEFIHTNGIEGAWSLLKRQIYGIHHWVSDKHLNRYVSENDLALQSPGNGRRGPASTH